MGKSVFSNINIFKLPKYRYYFVAIDFTALILSFIFAAYLYQQKYKDEYQLFNLLLSTFLYLIIFAIIFIFIFDINSMYKINIMLSRTSHVIALIKSYFYGILIMAAAFFFAKPTNILDSRLFVISFIITSLFLLYVFRVELIRFIFKKQSGKSIKRNVLIVGDGRGGKLLATRIMLENPFGINILGFIDDSKPVGEEIVHGKKIIGNINQIQNIIDRFKVDEILISIDNISYDKLLETLDRCKSFDVNIRLNSELFDIVAKKISTERYSGIPMIEIAPGYNTTISVVLKRVFDIIAALAGTIILLPVFLIIAALIKLSSEGSILFTQTRIGKGGKPFKFYKFRTMYKLDGEDEKRKEMMIGFMKGNGTETSDTKVVNDSRVTWIGKILRKTSIDELPQLFNVIKGDMSLVGPRPCLPYEYENYDEWQKRRLNVLPGCTGVWQISGRSSVSFIDSVVLDLFYINTMSPWFDLQILLKTIPVVLLGRGGK